jgi:predicted nucleic acid-binding protein
MILVDGGALVALVDVSDGQHRRCVSALKELREPMATAWPVVTEALDRLVDVPRGQEAVLEMLRRGAVRLVAVGQEDVPRLQELRARYGASRMGLAEAALVRVAEREGWDRVFTVDRRFEAYRIGRRKAFRLVPGHPGRRRAKRSVRSRRGRPGARGNG